MDGGERDEEKNVTSKKRRMMENINADGEENKKEGDNENMEQDTKEKGEQEDKKSRKPQSEGSWKI